jgi:hypothetical protein
MPGSVADASNILRKSGNAFATEISRQKHRDHESNDLFAADLTRRDSSITMLFGVGRKPH